MKIKHFFHSITKEHFIHALKVTAASLAALLIADFLGLDFAGSCAVIALITVADTKKETLLLTLKRLFTFLITMFLSFVLYQLIGIHYGSFALLMLMLAIISYSVRMYATISVNAVIATHILSVEYLTPAFILNETLLVLIGTMTAIIVNLYMPDQTKQIKQSVRYIETKEQSILVFLQQYSGSRDTLAKPEEELARLRQFIQTALRQAIRNKDNIFAAHSSYYIRYMDMRKQQCVILEQIITSLKLITYMPRQSGVISELYGHIAATFHEQNNAEELLSEAAAIELSLAEDDLPVTREEFENRAICYHVLLQLKRFLEIKKAFVEQLTDEQIKIYWQ